MENKMKNNVYIFIVCALFFVLTQSVICMEQLPKPVAEKAEQIQLLQLAEARMGQVKKYLSERWLGTKAQEHARAALAKVNDIKKIIKDSSLAKNYQEAIHRLIGYITEQASLAEAAAEQKEELVSEAEATVVENDAAVEEKIQGLSQEIAALKVRMAEIRHLTTLRWEGTVAQEYAKKAYESMRLAENIVNGRPLAVNYAQFFATYVRRVDENIRLAKASEERELPNIMRAEREFRRRQEKRERRQEEAQSREESQQEEGAQEGKNPFVGRDVMTIEQAYRILGIAREDQNDSGTIKKAYRSLALIHHPDKAVNDQNVDNQEEKKQQATESMQRINAAYQILKESINF